MVELICRQPTVYCGHPVHIISSPIITRITIVIFPPSPQIYSVPEKLDLDRGA